MTLGRPSKIGQVIDHVDGKAVTVADRIIELVSAGSYLETAAAAAGIDRTTLHDWLRRGARLAAKREAGELPRPTAEERRLLDFSHTVGRAAAESEARDVVRLERLARGGIVKETVTEKLGPVGANGARPVIERTVKRDTTLPDANVLTWRLERRAPDRWGRRTAVEHSGPGGGAIPVSVQAEHMVETIQGILLDLGLDPEDATVRTIVGARLRGMSAALQQAIPAESELVAR